MQRDSIEHIMTVDLLTSTVDEVDCLDGFTLFVPFVAFALDCDFFLLGLLDDPFRNPFLSPNVACSSDTLH